MFYLNLPTISREVFGFWREQDSHEVLYTWDAMMERTAETYNRRKPASLFLRALLAMVVYTELEKDGRLN